MAFSSRIITAPPETPAEQPADARPAWERIAYAWLEREVDGGQPVTPGQLARDTSVAPRFAADLLVVLRAQRQRDPQLVELRGRLAGDRITQAFVTRELGTGQRLDPAELAGEVGTTATVARQWLHTLRAGQQTDRRLAALRSEPASHGRPTQEQLAALQAAYAGGGRPNPNPLQRQQLDAGASVLARIEQLWQQREVASGRRLDAGAVARELGVSQHYVRGTLAALRGGKLTTTQRIQQLWQTWEAEGGQRLAAAEVARIVGVREGRVRQVLGPLRRALRNRPTSTPNSEREGRPLVVEDGGRQAWLDQAACRDHDPERFFPDTGEHTKAAEAKAICAGCPVRNHCLELAVTAAPGLDGDYGIFGGTLPTERSRLRPNQFPAPSVLRQDREAAEQAHQLACQVGLRGAARQLGIHRDALRAAFQQWGLAKPASGQTWQPTRFLADRAEAERAFRLAEQLGSLNAAAQQLGTTWPSLRKAFHRHGLSMPARNPQALSQRASEAARQRHPARRSHPLIRRLWRSTGVASRSAHEASGSWPSGCAAPSSTRPWARRRWWSCSANAPPPNPAPGCGRSRAGSSAPQRSRANAPARSRTGASARQQWGLPPAQHGRGQRAAARARQRAERPARRQADRQQRTDRDRHHEDRHHHQQHEHREVAADGR